MSVNLSAQQLLDAQLVSQVAEMLDERQLAPATVTLEITESALMSDTEATLAGLAELTAVGVRLTIDDFAPATRRSRIRIAFRWARSRSTEASSWACQTHSSGL